MKSKKMIATILEVVLVIVAFLVINYQTQGKIKPTKVYVYSQNIEDAGTEIGPNLVKEATLPKKFINDNYVTNISDMKGLQTDTKVYAGEYVLKSHLKESGQEDPIQQIDWSANRVVAVPVTNASPNLRKGARVDLIFVGEGERKSKQGNNTDDQNRFSYSKVFMQDVVVVSAPGDAQANSKDGKNAPTQATGASSDGAQTIKVAVTLGQAEEIASRANVGKILIAQRQAGAEKYDTLGYIMGDYDKQFTGHGNAETGSTQITEDTFKEVKPQK